MNIVDFSPIPYQGGNLGLGMKLRGIFTKGLGWSATMKSQEVVITALQKVFDNRYYLLRNVPLPNTKTVVPLIFFGPHGLYMFSNHTLRGVYRAIDDRWEIMNKGTSRFIPARPNLVTATNRLVFQLEQFFKANSISTAIEPILVFTEPGFHIDTERPDIRIVLGDAVDRFAIRLARTEPNLSAAEVLDLYSAIKTAIEPQEVEVEDVVEAQGPGIGHAIETRFDQLIAPLQKRFNFQRKQWLLLVAFVIFDIVILLVFLIFIFFTA